MATSTPNGTRANMQPATTCKVCAKAACMKHLASYLDQHEPALRLHRNW